MIYYKKNQQTITETIMSYSVMGNADELELETGDLELLPTSAISRLYNSDGTETADETSTRRNLQSNESTEQIG